jgi:hypothetical protein
MKKFPPIPIRDRGGVFELNNPDDGTPIKEMFKLGDGLLMITEKCTYRVQLADQIDPKRQNPALPPNFQQRLFDHGIHSDLLCRTLLQSKVLFRKEFQSIDIACAMQLALDATSDLIAAQEIALAFTAAESAAIEKVERLETKGSSLTLPSVGNVRVHCKSFAQKAHHFAASLLNIVRLFYPEMKGKGWDEFHELVKATYGSEDLFCKVLDLATPFLKLVRNARDCLDHANVKGVETSDFTPLPDGTVERPSIKIDFRKTVHERCPVSWFMQETVKALADSFEMIVTHSCSRHSKPIAGFPMTIGHLSDTYQAAMHVRFAYGMYYEGQGFIPCG